jgi:hypothetical protein
MSAVHRYDEPPPDEEDHASSQASTLTGRLDARLAELTRSGYRIQWIEVSEKELVTLFVEGGDEVIVMDPDLGIDRAWYGKFEIRPTEKDLIWIYLEGEYEGLSVHIVS